MTHILRIPAALAAALGFSAMLACAGAQAQSQPRAAAAVVEAVQAPAWVDRGGAAIPAEPGMALRAGDQVRTGGASRLLVRTADGSSVKLGENATLRFDALEVRERNLLASVMNVAEGAFRFTTDVAAKFRTRRQVDIRFANVTAGIRGTDLWGKSSPDRQVVCLIEGDIEVQPPNESSIRMSTPLQFYIRDRGVSQPVAPVPAEQLQLWAQETEAQPGRGVSRRGGQWKVLVATVDAQDRALAVYDAVRALGYPARIQPADAVDGRREYAVRVTSLASQQDAAAVASVLATALAGSGALAGHEPRAVR